jgi:EAL domain-containing protein (putative c-di-GMP-specific phosphodiesterase class I)
MVAHINSMAHEFGLKTVAEFVEDEMTAKMLAEMGVDYAQGHYFGWPARPEERTAAVQPATSGCITA